MRINARFGYLVAEVIVVVLVMIIFKAIPDRQIASLLAGGLFVMMPLILMILEYRCAQLQNFFWFVVVLQFWTLFALPIFALRVLNWGVPFEELTFVGISGSLLHQWSSKSYMVMMIFTLWIWLKSRKEGT